MRRIRLGVPVALLLAVMLVAQAPARLLNHLIPEDRLLLQGIEGTLWEGSAARALLPTVGGYLHLGALQWQLSPWSLLSLAPRVTVNSRWGNQQLSGVIVYHSNERIRLGDVDATLPASLVRQFLPLELRGDLSLLAAHLEIREGLPYAADGRLVWRGGGWVSPQGPRTLGDYAMDFRQPAGDALVGDVTTLAGSLRAEGRVTLTGSDYDIDVLLAGDGLRDPQLRQALQLVAAPEGEDFRLSMQGSLNQGDAG